MHLSWAQQSLFGLLPGRDFVDPGMPLAWAASALVQALWPGPFAEAVLSIIMLAVTAALTCWLVTRLTGSSLAAVAAALTAAVVMPRLYNYPKLLVPALTLWLLQRYVERRSMDRLAAVGAGLTAAALFRHDLGLYASIVAFVVLAVTHRDSPRSAIRAVLFAGAAALVVAAPYLIYVGWSEGLAEHVRRGLEFAKGESNQLQYDRPTFPSLGPGNPAWSREDATAFLYYGSWALPIVALFGLRRTAARNADDRLPLAVGATAFLALYLPIILRYPLDQRLPDIATPLVIVGAFAVCWSLGVTAFNGAHHARSPALRRLVHVPGVLLLVLALGGVINAAYLGQLPRQIEETRIERGIPGLISKVRSVHGDGTDWPWTAFWPNSGGFPPAVLYIRACTPADAYVLMTWASPEYYFFAQRRFASGLSMFLPPLAFTTERDQAFVLRRLGLEQPPIALVNKTGRESFRRAYPLVDAWIVSHYREAATYRHYDNDEIAISVRNDLRPTSTFGSDDWPCGFVSDTAASAAER